MFIFSRPSASQVCTELWWCHGPAQELLASSRGLLQAALLLESRHPPVQLDEGLQPMYPHAVMPHEFAGGNLDWQSQSRPAAYSRYCEPSDPQARWQALARPDYKCLHSHSKSRL